MTFPSVSALSRSAVTRGGFVVVSYEVVGLFESGGWRVWGDIQPVSPARFSFPRCVINLFVSQFHVG